MVTFASPWFLSLLLLIPILFVVKNLLSKSKNGVLKLSSRTIVSSQMIKKGQLKNRILTFFHFVVIILIIIGLARPRIIQSLQEKSIEVIDIVLVIDISSSMLATDFKPNRLEVVKKTAKNFIEKRDGDRLGILVFAGESFIQCPLTVDIDVLNNLINEINVADREYDGTAIGMAIANATNRLRDSEAESKIMILLSVCPRLRSPVDKLSMVALPPVSMAVMDRRWHAAGFKGCKGTVYSCAFFVKMD